MSSSFKANIKLSHPLKAVHAKKCGCVKINKYVEKRIFDSIFTNIHRWETSDTSDNNKKTTNAKYANYEHKQVGNIRKIPGKLCGAPFTCFFYQYNISEETFFFF